MKILGNKSLESFSPFVTSEVINELQISKSAELAGLREIYARIPATRCECKAHCCSMLPEATLLEALAVIERLNRETDSQRQELLKKIVRYFFINPAQITACPFLDEKRCSIYKDRFFGCRAYGLWSPTHYENMADQNRQAKLTLSQHWQKLGIRLPEKVIDFNQPYCLDVDVVEDFVVADSELVRISIDIDALSDQLHPWHRIFKGMYYSDFSFLAAAMIYEIRKLLQMKVDIVRDYIAVGRSDILDRALKSDWRNI